MCCQVEVERVRVNLDLERRDELTDEHLEERIEAACLLAWFTIWRESDILSEPQLTKRVVHSSRGLQISWGQGIHDRVRTYTVMPVSTEASWTCLLLPLFDSLSAALAPVKE